MLDQQIGINETFNPNGINFNIGSFSYSSFTDFHIPFIASDLERLNALSNSPNTIFLHRAQRSGTCLALKAPMLPLRDIPNFVFYDLENKTEALMPVAANRIHTKNGIKSIYNI
ncbi:hypothetical protein AVEN_52443-1 [Araneus ventricosus]|uniref:Uncharacterized protein n=1 Tax=Araneus ventricosus TaxID=182803 RepID=A0A4Y2CXZ5_ARAVE|nr:hypothetical protein AVEN_52443-1 [Araneus ventricosus]